LKRQSLREHIHAAHLTATVVTTINARQCCLQAGLFVLQSLSLRKRHLLNLNGVHPGQASDGAIRRHSFGVLFEIDQFLHDVWLTSCRN